MTKEVLKQALEAFGEIEWSNNSQWQSDRAKVAIATLKEALANEALEKMAENARELGLDYEPEQEPVAWMNDSTPSGIFARHMEGAKNFGCTIPLYTTPPHRKPLTDKQILADETLRYYFGLNGGAGPVSKQGRKIVNAIEALHNIKETEK